LTDNKSAIAAIEARFTALEDAWNRHDAKAYAACVAEDVDFTNVFGIAVHGRAAIEASHEAIFRTMFKDSTLRVDSVNVRFIRPDIAAADMRWEMVGARDPHGKDWPKRHGLMSAIAVEEAGAWSLKVIHNRDLPPPERVAEIAGLLKR
jgi:uncharacterized protein (TIGR02246 family)